MMKNTLVDCVEDDDGDINKDKTSSLDVPFSFLSKIASIFNEGSF